MASAYQLSNQHQKLRYSWRSNWMQLRLASCNSLRKSRAQFQRDQRRDLPTAIRVRVFCGGHVIIQAGG